MKPTNMAKLVKMEKVNREVGGLIGQAIKEQGGGYGFALFMFSFGEGTEMTWISNAERPDMVKALREFIETVERGKDDEFAKAKRWNANAN